MPYPRISRRSYYATMLADALTATSADVGGRSLVVGIAISIAGGLMYVVLAGNQDDPILIVVAILVAALGLVLIVFVAHLVLTPARLHQRALDTWMKIGDSMIDSWKESNRATHDNWRESNRATIDHWNKSNDIIGYALLKLSLSMQIESAMGLREHLAASQRAGAADDGELRAMVDSWDGSTASYVQGVSESEREFYLRDSAVPTSSGRTWQQDLRDFVVLREARLQEVYDRYKDRNVTE